MEHINNRYQVHLQNKREAFDAMRAYHQSEIHHKEHAILIFRTVLTSIGVMFVGFIGIYIKDPKIFENITLAIAIIPAMAAFIILPVIYFTNNKINLDHDIYNLFKKECQTERKILKLNDDLRKKCLESSYWYNTVEMKKEGYKLTKKIIFFFGIAIILLSGTVYLILYLIFTK